MNKIFVSYNPSASAEQSLALRLQTLGALYGLHIALPDRLGRTTLKDTTKQRIDACDLFVVFSTRNVAKVLRDEIVYARTLGKKIVIIYDKDVAKNLKLRGVVEVEYDHKKDHPETLIKTILQHIRPTTAAHKTAPRKTVANKVTSRKTLKRDGSESIAAFLLVGLGLLLLGAAMADANKK